MIKILTIYILVWLTAYQLFMGHLMPKFHSFLNAYNLNYLYFSLVKGISTNYGLYNAKIWLISKCLKL